MLNKLRGGRGVKTNNPDIRKKLTGYELTGYGFERQKPVKRVQSKNTCGPRKTKLQKQENIPRCYINAGTPNRMCDTQCSGPHLPLLNFGGRGGRLWPNSNFC